VVWAAVGAALGQKLEHSESHLGLAMLAHFNYHGLANRRSTSGRYCHGWKKITQLAIIKLKFRCSMNGVSRRRNATKKGGKASSASCVFSSCFGRRFSQVIFHTISRWMAELQRYDLRVALFPSIHGSDVRQGVSHS